MREKNQKEKENKKSEKQLVIKESLFIKPKEVKKVMLARQKMYLLIPNYMFLFSGSLEFPQCFDTFLKEFEDVFPQDNPHGLPPLRGIEHQIDLILGASLPNRATYRSNPEETKEIQKKVEGLMQKGWVKESLSPCAMLVILVPKKDGMWRM